MRESTFCLLIVASLFVVAMIDDNSVRSSAGLVMAFGFILVSRICAAIEKNGKNK